MIYGINAPPSIGLLDHEALQSKDRLGISFLPGHYSWGNISSCNRRTFLHSDFPILPCWHNEREFSVRWQKEEGLSI